MKHWLLLVKGLAMPDYVSAAIHEAGIPFD